MKDAKIEFLKEGIFNRTYSEFIYYINMIPTAYV